MAAIALREHPGETIVTDSCTSNGLAAFIKDLGGRHFRHSDFYFIYFFLFVLIFCSDVLCGPGRPPGRCSPATCLHRGPRRGANLGAESCLQSGTIEIVCFCAAPSVLR